MVSNGIPLDITREALWLIDEWFDKQNLQTSTDIKNPNNNN